MTVLYSGDKKKALSVKLALCYYTGQGRGANISNLILTCFLNCATGGIARDNGFIVILFVCLFV